MKFDQKSYQPNDNESVLDCLLRHDVAINYSCKSGNCQACLVRSLVGDIDLIAQKNLKPTFVKLGYFLACQQNASRVQQAARIRTELLFIPSKLLSKEMLNRDVCQLILRLKTPFDYRAGQFVNIKNSYGVVRSYSIACTPNDNNEIELHIKRKENGLMTRWIFDELEKGDDVEIQGPIGECFYSDLDPSSQLILIGTGTGAAPLLGILKDALNNNHQGTIAFYHGGRTLEELYLHQKLSELTLRHTNLKYIPCLSERSEQDTEDNSSPVKLEDGYCNQIALDRMQPNANTLLYLCGNPEMVKQTQRSAFLKGISSSNIYIDPFEYKDLRETPR
ncbi:MAG: 2Fe-2S iron-sulfur cluster binding domain-containing protein [Kangiellaceae bacterium]|nr:2Fe-2S iron-sulfur cluster binding domain-containing protein [Kangiellaceae bacterium]